MADQRTSFTIEAKARGFAEVDKAADSLKDTLGEVKLDASSTKAYAEGLTKLGVSAKSLNKQLEDAGKLASKNVTAGFTKMAAAMKQVSAQVHSTWDALKRMQSMKPPSGGGGGRGGDDQFGPTIPGGGRGNAPRDPRSGSFTQGLLEGAMPGYRVIDRGPGAVRQATGIAAGSFGRNVASLPFTGGRVGQSLQNTFGFLAAPISGLEEKAEQRVGFEQQQVGLQAYMGGYGVTNGVDTGGALRRAGLTNADIQRHVRAASRGGVSRGDLTKSAVDAATAAQREAVNSRMQQLSGNRALSDYTHAGRESLRLRAAHDVGAPTNGHLSARYLAEGIGRSQRDALIAQTRRAAINPLSAAARDYAGVSLPEAQQQIAQVAQSAGGTAADIARQGPNAVKNVFAYQTRLGIGAQTQGAFAQAARVGGIAGGPNERDNGKQFERAVEQGFKLGLRGSELTDYMGRMASSIEAWKTSGIPLAPESVDAMGRTLEKSAGMAGPRAAIAAQNAVSDVQNIGHKGVQSAEDYFKMQAFAPDDGKTSYFERARKMERGLSAEEMSAGTKRYEKMAFDRGGGNFEIGSRLVQKAFESQGVNMTGDEVTLMEKQRLGMKLTESEQAQASATKKRLDAGMSEAMGGDKVRAGAYSSVGGIARTEAGRKNTALAQGAALIPELQAMHKASDNLANAYKSLVDPLISFSKGIEHFTSWVSHLPFFGGSSSHPTIKGHAVHQTSGKTR